MRVLYFSRDYTSHDHRFLSALAGTHHEIFSVRLEKRGTQGEDRPLPSAITQVVWDGGKSGVERKEYRSYAAKLGKVIRQIQPDVVHAGSIQTAALVAAMANAKGLVSMSWGYDMLMDANRTPRMRQDTRKTLNNSRVVVCDCDAVRTAVTAFGFPESRIIQFPWGTDTGHFHPGYRERDRNAFGWKPDQFVILSLRAWEAMYDVKTVVEAFIKAVRVEPKLYLVLLGGGSQQNLLRQMLMQAGVMDSVLFGGRVGYDQLPAYYRSADVYVSASLTDGSSVSLLEAMACGTPALVSDIAGNREWIQENAQGWLFPVGKADILAEKMLNAYRAQKELHPMRYKARQCIEERGNWQENFPKLLTAYAMACEEQKN